MKECLSLFGSKRSPVGRNKQEDYSSKNSVQLIGEGSLSLLMLEELSKRGINVTSYLFKDIPETKIDKRIKAEEFSDKKSLVELLGGSSCSLVFNLGLKIPKKGLEKARILGLHPSYLPDEYTGEKNPVKKMVEQGREYGAVTLFELDQSWDDGPVYGHIRFKLKSNPKSGKDKDIISQIYKTSVVPAAAKLFAAYMENPIRYISVTQKRLLDEPIFNRR
jgi:folate-dependent phosphoribosylglycinamide formyltransferase PurN